ncbi:MAG: hypothetical protein JXO72_01490 [Vicinamibacteria bacterium]|nr:hypothetical protein [Vicinamibacteria bacterium]
MIPAHFDNKTRERLALISTLLMTMGCGTIDADQSADSFSHPSSADASPICAALPPPAGTIVRVATVNELVAAVNGATAGTTIVIANGTYALNGAYLRIDTPGVTLRSESSDRDSVVLDGDYVTTEIVQIAASNVTVADLTLREAYDHPIHVVSTSGANTDDTLIHNVRIIDPGQQAIKVNPVDGAHFTDGGVIECSRIELTDAGRAFIRDNCYTGGIDVHQARDWIVRDNAIEGFWCASGFSEHAIHFWRGCRDTLVERNVLRDNARGVGFGLAATGVGRTYPDDPCPGAGGGHVDHFGGIVRNNFVSAGRDALFSSEYGFDCGICLWQACGAAVLHNTVFSTAAPFSSIEWRFEHTDVDIRSNLVSHNLRARDGAAAVEIGNVAGAQSEWFSDPTSGDLHLAASATEAVDQATVDARATEDFDGDPRPIGAAADVGADERHGTAPVAPQSLRLGR